MKSPTLALALLLAAISVQAQPQAPAPQAAASALPSSPAKKELVQRLLTQQQGAIETISRSVIGRPLVPLVQRANAVLHSKVPAAKREAVAKTMDAEIRKFFDEAVPVLRDRALKLAPVTYGTAFEEKFTEEELRQFVTWLESSAYRKFQQFGPDMQTVFTQQLGAEANALLGAKLQALEQRLSSTLGVPTLAGGEQQPAEPKPKGNR